MELESDLRPQAGFRLENRLGITIFEIILRPDFAQEPTRYLGLIAKYLFTASTRKRSICIYIR